MYCLLMMLRNMSMDLHVNNFQNKPLAQEKNMAFIAKDSGKVTPNFYSAYGSYASTLINSESANQNRSITYEYSANGTLTSATTTVTDSATGLVSSVESQKYDSEGQLSGSEHTSYSYDKDGNLTKKTTVKI